MKNLPIKMQKALLRSWLFVKNNESTVFDIKKLRYHSVNTLSRVRDMNINDEININGYKLKRISNKDEIETLILDL